MKTLLTAAEIRDEVRRLADRLNHDYADRPLTLIAVMTGSITFMADLMRLLEMPLRVGVVQASSYRGGTKSGELKIDAALMPDVAHRDVLLVDDIFDTGKTLSTIVRLLSECGAREVRTAVLLAKDVARDVNMVPDYVVFRIPNEFVVGYGLDYQDCYRNLEAIVVLEESDLARHVATASAD